VNIRSLPPWRQRDLRIAEHREKVALALGYVRTYVNKHGDASEYAQPDLTSAAKYDALIDHLLAIDWKEIGAHAEPKTPEDKRALADTLEAWAKSLRDDADKEITNVDRP
jgi:hypothetical protein